MYNLKEIHNLLAPVYVDKIDNITTSDNYIRDVVNSFEELAEKLDCAVFDNRDVGCGVLLDCSIKTLTIECYVQDKSCDLLIGGGHCIIRDITIQQAYNIIKVLQENLK